MIRKIICVSFLLFFGGVGCFAQECLTIGQLFERVEQNSKDLQVQKTALEVAQREIEIARNGRLPDINAQLSLSYIGNALLADRNFSNLQKQTSPHYGNNFALDAKQVVYAGGAVNASIELARLGMQQAEAGGRLTRQQACFIALGQYLELFKIDNGLKVYGKNIKLTEQLIAEIKAKQQQGMALKNDITRYELQLESLKLGQATLRNNRSIINHQLCNTLGMEQDVWITPDTTLCERTYGKEGEAYWQQHSAANSPLMEQSTLNVDMAQQKEKIAKSELLPKVALVAVDNLNGPITFELPPVDKNLNIWYVGIGVDYNFSSLFKSSRRVKQAALETRQAREQHALQVEHLNNSVQQAYVQYLQTYTELEIQQKSVELARQNYDVVNARYLSQLDLVTAMVDASNLRLNAELQEVDARINIVYAYYRLKYVAGEI